MPRRHDEKLFGKYNEFILLILGFILSGLVGSYIAQVYTRRSSELQVATQLFKDEVKSVGDRIFAENQVFIGLQDRRLDSEKSEHDLHDRWTAYRLEIQHWNSGRAFTTEMLRLYFGQEAADREKAIHYSLRAWGVSLEKQFNTPGAVDMQCLQNKRDEILTMTHSFGAFLAETIRAGNIGSAAKQRSTLRNENLPKVFCLTQSESVQSTDSEDSDKQ